MDSTICDYILWIDLELLGPILPLLMPIVDYAGYSRMEEGLYNYVVSVNVIETKAVL